MVNDRVIYWNILGSEEGYLRRLGAYDGESWVLHPITDVVGGIFSSAYLFDDGGTMVYIIIKQSGDDPEFVDKVAVAVALRSGVDDLGTGPGVRPRFLFFIDDPLADLEVFTSHGNVLQ